MAAFEMNEVIITSDCDDQMPNACIWDMKTSTQLVNFESGQINRNCLCMIGQDYLIAGLNEANLLKVWPVLKEKGINGSDMVVPEKITALDVDHSGTFCVGAMSKNLYLWLIATGELLCVFPAHMNHINCVKFTKDRQFIISCSMDGFVKAWKLTEVLGATANSKLPKAKYSWDDHPDDVVHLSVSRYGSENIVTISNIFCNVYSLESGDCVYQFTNEGSPLFCSAVDSLNTFIFLGKMDGVILRIEPTFIDDEKENFNEDKKAPIKVFNQHRMAVTCLGTSTNGQFLVSGSVDKTAIVWSISTAQVLCVLKHSGAVLNAFFYMGMPALYDENFIPRGVIKPFQLQPFYFNLDECHINQKPLEPAKIEEMNKSLEKTTTMEPQVETQNKTSEELKLLQKRNELLRSFVLQHFNMV